MAAGLTALFGCLGLVYVAMGFAMAEGLSDDLQERAEEKTGLHNEGKMTATAKRRTLRRPVRRQFVERSFFFENSGG